MGPLSPTMQDTVRDKGLWERPLAGRVIAQPGGAGAGAEEWEQAGRQATVREGVGARNTR